MKIIHEGKEKQYTCGICNKKLMDLRGHVRLNHADLFTHIKGSRKESKSKLRSTKELKKHYQSLKKPSHIQKVIIKYY